MDEGEVRDGCITCPWHGSVFRVDNGALVQGPSTVDLPSYQGAASRPTQIEVPGPAG